MSDRIKVGHYQCECHDGDFPANAEKVIEGLEYAEANRVEIMSFPESYLTGYFADEPTARQHSFELGSPQIKSLVERTKNISATWMVGFNERRDGKLFNTVIVVERGEVLGRYSKAFPCYAYFTPGREFPVFHRNGVPFAVAICADGGYVEPCRILALKGARIIFAPHYNAIKIDGLINHFTFVRSDHTARAVENGVWFLRGNNVKVGKAGERQMYGDSYLVDPNGEIVIRSRRHAECFVVAEIDLSGWQYHRDRSMQGGRALGKALQETLNDLEDPSRHFC
ncbi:MAG: carbon-nitrogen hydrolase family protein [Candidatus Poribacteria bacterium]|nr:carbon-nitrogen hydrolase family protein [Candidatus Poribacteria bacterium]